MISLFSLGVWLIWPLAVHQIAEAILAANAPEVSRPAPDFHLPDASGTAISLSGMRGKVVLLNFWATWCAPCRKEIPWFIEFQRELQGRGFTVIGVSTDDEGWTVVKPSMAEMGINYPVVLIDDWVTRLYRGIETLPTTMLIGRDGKIAYIHTGLVDKERYRREILPLL